MKSPIFCDHLSLTDEQYIAKLEGHLLKAMDGEPIKIPDEVLEHGCIVEFCRSELAKRK